MLNDIYGYSIVLLGLFVGFSNIYLSIKLKDVFFKFLRALYAIIGLYFSVVFFYVIEYNIITTNFGMTYFRPAIALMIGTISASTILTLKAGLRIWKNY
jgi:hypothetical protein